MHTLISPKAEVATTITRASPSRSSTRNNPTPLDVTFILFASVALTALILSFAARGPNVPTWLSDAVTGIWTKVLAIGGASVSLALRKWLDNRPKPNYLVWIPGFTVFLLTTVVVVLKMFPTPVTTGTIVSPTRDEIVSRTIACNGTAIFPTKHLWLAVEVNNQVWPREGEVDVMPNGSWMKTVYEDGVADRFSISLLLANPKADMKIREWQQGGQAHNYTELERMGVRRLARVDGLKLAAPRVNLSNAPEEKR